MPFAFTGSRAATSEMTKATITQFSVNQLEIPCKVSIIDKIDNDLQILRNFSVNYTHTTH